MDPKNYIGTKNFYLCKNRTTLEVGPFDGIFTDLILKEQPKKLILLEAHRPSIVDSLSVKYQRDDVEIIYGDMHYDFDKVGKVDVAILYGVIYHSHAPLLVFEELVNYCDPDFILLDAPGSYEGWGITAVDETADDPGMRQLIDKTWKSCNIVTPLNEETIIRAFENLGYVCADKKKSIMAGHWKSFCPIFKFKKQVKNENTNP